MPMHDWKRVKPGIFHHFHGNWIFEICAKLNSGLLPGNFYALGEQDSGEREPDVAGLEYDPSGGALIATEGGTLLLAEPRTLPTIEQTDEDRRQPQRHIAIRHVTNDRIVAAIEVVSPGNKHSVVAFEEFQQKCLDFLEAGIHLVVLDPHPPTKSDPKGIHAAIWERISDQPIERSLKPLSMFSYEAGFPIRAFVEPVEIGDSLPELPVFFQKKGCIYLPLEETYMRAWERMPIRWRKVIQP